MNTALLALRVVTGVLLIGHGLQKLVPARFSLGTGLLRANGNRGNVSRRLGSGTGVTVWNGAL